MMNLINFNLSINGWNNNFVKRTIINHQKAYTIYFNLALTWEILKWAYTLQKKIKKKNN